jgi:hypothetical protein
VSLRCSARYLPARQPVSLAQPSSALPEPVLDQLADGIGHRLPIQGVIRPKQALSDEALDLASEHLYRDAQGAFTTALAEQAHSCGTSTAAIPSHWMPSNLIHSQSSAGPALHRLQC